MRKLLAIWAGKSVTLVGKLLKKRTSAAPGQIAAHGPAGVVVILAVTYSCILSDSKRPKPRMGTAPIAQI